MINFLYLFNFLECGHFCIKYILKKEKIKARAIYRRKMMSFALVKKVMKEYFCNVEVYKVSELESLSNKKRIITIIKRGKFLHYVVIERIENNMIYYYDPLFLSLRKKKIGDFNRIWFNYCCFYH